MVARARAEGGRDRLTVLRLAAAACATFALAGCGGGGPPTGQKLTALDGVAPLRAAFNADDGHPRLLLVLSPT